MTRVSSSFRVQPLVWLRAVNMRRPPLNGVTSYGCLHRRNCRISSGQTFTVQVLEQAVLQVRSDANDA